MATETQRRLAGWAEWVAALAVGLLILAAPARAEDTELVLKVLVVNPSTEVKEFTIRQPLPPEVKPEHVLDADGLSVEYDSQAGAYMLVGSVTLKPKESVTRKVVLGDAWVIPSERVSSLRDEVEDVTKKLKGTTYIEQGRVLASAITRRLFEIEESQSQLITNPQQHISRYRDDMKTLQLIESDMVSLRQLMVMASLRGGAASALSGDGAGEEGSYDRGRLSILTTWRMIFLILVFLGAVSLSFFFVWQRQLKVQLAKQAVREQGEGHHGATLSNGTTSPLGTLGNAPPPAPRVGPKAPFSP